MESILRNCFELCFQMKDMNWPREKGEFLLREQTIWGYEDTNEQIMCSGSKHTDLVIAEP